MNLTELYQKGRLELEAILHAWNTQDLPDGFANQGVMPVQLDREVGLTNEYGQILILDDADHRLKFWYELSHGETGTLEELLNCDPNEYDFRDVREIEKLPGYAALIATGKYPAWEDDPEEEDEETEE